MKDHNIFANCSFIAICRFPLPVKKNIDLKCKNPEKHQRAQKVIRN
jgi:hypothetical protein